MKQAILLLNGRQVVGEVLVSAEADFERNLWSFAIDADTRIGAGEYIVIATRDLLPFACHVAARGGTKCARPCAGDSCGDESMKRGGQ